MKQQIMSGLCISVIDTTTTTSSNTTMFHTGLASLMLFHYTVSVFTFPSKLDYTCRLICMHN